MAAQFSSFDWYFLSCIFSKGIDIAVFAVPALVQRLVFLQAFSVNLEVFTYEGFSIWKPFL